MLSAVLVIIIGVTMLLYRIGRLIAGMIIG